MGTLFRNVLVQQATDERERPSHFRDDQNERDILPAPDYPTEQSPAVAAVPTYPVANPVPVYQVEPPPADRTLRNWAPGSMTVTTTPQQLTGADRRRTRMVVTNNDATNSVYLMKGKDDISVVSYVLAPGREAELTHNDPVYARAVANTAAIAWFTEHDVEDC